MGLEHYDVALKNARHHRSIKLNREVARQRYTLCIQFKDRLRKLKNQLYILQL